MAPRVTGREVKTIIRTRVNDVEAEPFVETAHVVVNTHLGGAGLGDDLLRQIELWLAAHLIAVEDPRVRSKSIDGLALTFEGQSGLGLDATRYGQQVRLLDPTGKLAALQDPTPRPRFGYWTNAGGRC